MGDGDGGRCKTSERDGRYASELVVCILREVDSANAYVVELGDAVDRKDRQRIAELLQCGLLKGSFIRRRHFV